MKGYFTLKGHLDNKDVHVRTIDLYQGLMLLSILHPEEFDVVLAHGLLGIPQEECEPLLEMEQQRISEVYLSGVAHITSYLNGE